MATASSEAEDQKTSLTGCPKRKSVQIKEDATQIIEIKEKHGPLYNAIPCMALPLAAFCCVINILIPGFGEYSLIKNTSFESDDMLDICFA